MLFLSPFSYKSHFPGEKTLKHWKETLISLEFWKSKGKRWDWALCPREITKAFSSWGLFCLQHSSGNSLQKILFSSIFHVSQGKHSHRHPKQTDGFVHTHDMMFINELGSKTGPRCIYLHSPSSTHAHTYTHTNLLSCGKTHSDVAPECHMDKINIVCLPDMNNWPLHPLLVTDSVYCTW